AAHVLGRARIAREDAATARSLRTATAQGDPAQHVSLHVGENVAHVLVLVVVPVYVDDDHVVELALHRLLPCMRQEAGGVEFIDGDAAAAVGDQVHGHSSFCSKA